MDYILGVIIGLFPSKKGKHTYGSIIHIGEKNGARYNQISVIGSGATSKVYLCEEEKYKKKVAVKLLFCADYEENELKIMSQLDHEHIVKFIDSFHTDDSFGIVMEFCKGGDLGKEIKEKKEKSLKFDMRTIFEWSFQIIEGLNYLHSNRIIHRNIKPSNIFLTYQKQIKLGDLGASRKFDVDCISVTTNEIGTRPYMSPELRNGADYSYQTDIWSTGCTIYELITLNKYSNIFNLNEIHSNYKQFKKINSIRYLTRMLEENPAERIDSKEIKKSIHVIKTDLKKKFEEYTEKEFTEYLTKLFVTRYESTRLMGSMESENPIKMDENYESMSYEEFFSTPYDKNKKDYELYTIVVTGSSYAGISNFFDRYARNLFIPNRTDHFESKFYIKYLKWNSEKRIMLKLWSHKVFYGWRQVLEGDHVMFNDIDGFLILFDAISPNSIEYALDFKNSFSLKNSQRPFVLIANKSDAIQVNYDRSCNKELITECCKEIGFTNWFETSAKDDINVKQAFEYLITEIRKSKGL